MGERVLDPVEFQSRFWWISMKVSLGGSTLSRIDVLAIVARLL